MKWTPIFFSSICGTGANATFPSYRNYRKYEFPGSNFNMNALSNRIYHWDNEMGRPQTLNMGEGRTIAAVISILY